MNIDELRTTVQEISFLSKFINKYEGKKKDAKLVHEMFKYLDNGEYEKVFKDEVEND